MMFGRGAKKAKSEAVIERETRQLRRLEILVDVVFAIMFFRIFLLLPRPSAAIIEGFTSLRDFFASQSDTFGMVFIGILMTLIYWSQNIKVFGNLKRTDGTHAVLSFLQIFLLLVYLYFVRMEMVFKGDQLPLLLQSIFLALVGFFGVAAWSYALKDRRLITDSITDAEARDIRLQIMSEPITAVITIPFAFIGTTAWTLAWLIGLIVTKLLNRWRPKGETAGKAQSAG